ncbi:unnamed protein product [Chrysodeixis includens]|uniref:Uncharacterized protein n=1 Tax=Chrysodeixis includens TaxID=689277 RepID=A0A9N8KTG1_CHRIL|nr:unnamed protein product [Chrysodeixis includens]
MMVLAGKSPAHHFAFPRAMEVQEDFHQCNVLHNAVHRTSGVRNCSISAEEAHFLHQEPDSALRTPHSALQSAPAHPRDNRRHSVDVDTDVLPTNGEGKHREELGFKILESEITDPQ